MVERNFVNPYARVQFTKNRLPHKQQDGITYFVTFRLADSLPDNLLAQWRTERALWLKFHPEPWDEETELEYHQQFSATLENWFDQGHGECILRKSNTRECVEAVLLRFDGDRYQIHSSVIMPNHVHLLVSLAKGESLSKTIQTWKGISSKKITTMLESPSRQMEGRHSCRPDQSESTPAGRQECRPSRGGSAIWMKDYFDRMIRDAEHFWRCARYIRNNPKNAKLKSDAYTLFESEHVRDVLNGKACD